MSGGKGVNKVSDRSYHLQVQIEELSSVKYKLDLVLGDGRVTPDETEEVQEAHGIVCVVLPELLRVLLAQKEAAWLLKTAETERRPRHFLDELHDLEAMYGQRNTASEVGVSEAA
jgi:hypothetical protein